MKCRCATLNPLAGATRLYGENVCRHAVILHMFRTQLRFVHSKEPICGCFKIFNKLLIETQLH